MFHTFWGKGREVTQKCFRGDKDGLITNFHHEGENVVFECLEKEDSQY